MRTQAVIKNIVSVSSGKDSTATLLLALALETKNLSFVFADTGNEHPLAYEYLDYLEGSLNIKIKRVKADFSMQLERKRQKLLAGKLKGWGDKESKQAIEILKPTGSAFLDLCLWKGRFPSTKARFCSIELKVYPIVNQVFLPELDAGNIVYSWQGIRRDESLERRYAPEFEEVGGGLFNYRPIARWNVDSVFEAHRYFNIDPNPLYKLGMSRVGCMPCVNCAKSELREIAARFPEEINRVRDMERLTSLASRRGCGTFFCATDDPSYDGSEITYEKNGIDSRVEWSKTLRGGRKLDMFADLPPEACSSAYGLCE